MDLEQDPQRAAQLCCEAQVRLVHRVARVAPEDVRAPRACCLGGPWVTS